MDRRSRHQLRRIHRPHRHRRSPAGLLCAGFRPRPAFWGRRNRPAQSQRHIGRRIHIVVHRRHQSLLQPGCPAVRGCAGNGLVLLVLSGAERTRLFAGVPHRRRHARHRPVHPRQTNAPGREDATGTGRTGRADADRIVRPFLSDVRMPRDPDRPRVLLPASASRACRVSRHPADVHGPVREGRHRGIFPVFDDDELDP